MLRKLNPPPMTGNFITDQAAIDVSRIAGEDLSAKQYFAVKVDPTTTKIVLAGANEKCLGILQNAPVAGDVAMVRISGVTKAKIDEAGTIIAGNFMTPTSAGKLEICDAANEEYIGVLLGAFADEDLAEIIIARGEVTATDAT